MSLLVVASSTTQPAESSLIRLDNLSTIQVYDSAKSLPCNQLSAVSDQFILTVYSDRTKKLASVRADLTTAKSECAIPATVTAVHTTPGYLFGGTDSGLLYGWSSTDGAKLFEHQLHIGPISLIAVDRLNWILYAASTSGKIGSWSIVSLFSSSDPLHIWPLHTMSVTGLAISPNGRSFYSVSEDRSVRCIDAIFGTELASYSLSAACTCCCLANNGSALYVGCIDGVIVEVKLSEDADRREFLGHTLSVTDIKISSDDCALYSASLDHTVRRWDISAMQTVQHVQTRSIPVALHCCPPNFHLISPDAQKKFPRLQSSVSNKGDQLVSATHLEASPAYNPDAELRFAVTEQQTPTVSIAADLVEENDEEAQLRRQNALLFQKILELEAKQSV